MLNNNPNGQPPRRGVPSIAFTVETVSHTPEYFPPDAASDKLATLTNSIAAALESMAVRDQTQDNAAAMVTLMREAPMIAEHLAPNYLDFTDILWRFMNQPYTQMAHNQFVDALRGKQAMEFQVVLAGSMGRKLVRFTIGPMECLGIGPDRGIMLNFPLTYELI